MFQLNCRHEGAAETETKGGRALRFVKEAAGWCDQQGNKSAPWELSGEQNEKLASQD